jgi:3-isopropylmalate dehydrogenase
MILSVSMLVRWLGEHRDSPACLKAADAMDEAVDKVLADPASRTPDLGGKSSTTDFTQAVVQALR